MATETKTKISNGAFTRVLKARGFDRAYYDRSSGYHKAKCSQCEALVINGVPCHETGCPNQPRTDNE